MLDQFRQRWRDRRGQYSLRGHIARLKRERRLFQVGAGTLVAVVVAGVAFAQCQSNITGPEEVAESRIPGAPGSGSVSLSGGSSNNSDSDSDSDSDSEDSDSDKLIPGLDSDSDGDSDSDNIPVVDVPPVVFVNKTYDRNFAFAGPNPCNGEQYEATGSRFVYSRETLAPDYFETREHVRDKFSGWAVVDLPPRPTRYKGEDEHNHYSKVVFTEGSVAESVSEEQLVAVGPEPDWSLILIERRRIDFENPENTRYEVRAKGRCRGKCTLPGGCPEVDFKLVSSSEIVVPPLP